MGIPIALALSFFLFFFYLTNKTHFRKRRIKFLALMGVTLTLALTIRRLVNLVDRYWVV